MKPTAKVTPQKLNYLEQTFTATTDLFNAIHNKQPVDESTVLATLATADFYVKEYHQLLSDILQQDTRPNPREARQPRKSGPALRLIVGGKYHHMV